MSLIFNQENLDLIALQLADASIQEQVTGLQLIQYFDGIDGFWRACVEMKTPTSEDLNNLLPNDDGENSRINGSSEQVIKLGIRDPNGNLTASFCDWFERYCSFKMNTDTRDFLIPYLRPAEFRDLSPKPLSLTSNTRESHSQQLHIQFSHAVIQELAPSSYQSSTEIYQDFANKAVELADEQDWPQDLQVEIQPGTGLLLVKYLAKGKANRVSKEVSGQTFRKILATWRRKT
jgi:hypothetical protein